MLSVQSMCTKPSCAIWLDFSGGHADLHSKQTRAASFEDITRQKNRQGSQTLPDGTDLENITQKYNSMKQTLKLMKLLSNNNNDLIIVLITPSSGD